MDPIKNRAWIFDLGLVDAMARPSFKVNPTIAAGDFKVSIDDGALNNFATLPVVAPAGSRIVKVALSAAEMNGDRIKVQVVDQSDPKEWDDVLIDITTEGLTRILKNVALPAFKFTLADSSDHITPIGGRSVTAQRKIDAQAMAACANAVTEPEDAVYMIDLAASDLNGDVIYFQFTAPGADPLTFTIVTNLS